ncbi:MAG: carbonic anhydrase family protein [Bacteroidota bacterium]|jgi:carbonic anhydrase
MYTKEEQTKLSPDEALVLLKEGNERFRKNIHANQNLTEQVTLSSKGQAPFATILSCMDSRTSAELIFDEGLGDIFSIRIAGNVLNTDIIGSLEFATKMVGTKVIVVLGHTKCGAIVGACNNVELGHLTTLLNKIYPAVARETETKENRNGSNRQFVNNVTKINVELTIKLIRNESHIIYELEKNGDLKIIGAMYDVDTGIVTFDEWQPPV